MDPLSISASILTLLGAGSTLSKLLGKVIRLRDAPGLLLALEAEVSALRALVGDVEELLRAGGDADEDPPPPPSLAAGLARVKVAVERLERCVAYELCTVAADGEGVRLDRSVYWRVEGRVLELREEVRAGGVALGAAVGVFAAAVGVRNRVLAGRICGELERLRGELEMGRPALAGRGLGRSERGEFPRRECRTIGTRSGLLERRRPGGGSRSGYLKDRTRGDPGALSQPRNDDSRMVVSSEHGNQRRHRSASIVQLIQNSCEIGCRCPCHSNNQIRSPGFLHAILGSLFLSYRAYPSLNQACGVRCRAHAGGTTCVYAFPPWLLERAISISYSCALAKGPELLLRVMRRRDFESINALLTGRQSYALKEMKRMLDGGETSVLDIDAHGYTILHKVVFRRKWNLAHLLISYGADINYVNQEEKCPTSPFMDAWSRRWEQTLRQADIPENWDDLFFQDITQFDTFGFIGLHKAYLGLGGLTFDQALASTKRSDVDDSDYQGRTVLCWAAGRGDSQTVGKLLACGAHPDKKCAMHRSPLHFAASADVSTSELLLDAKADVNVTNGWGAMPMHYVTSRTSSLIKRMVDLGADIEKRDASGQTPLLYACRYGQAHAVKELLVCGADINARNLNGSTPILQAVMYNHHQTVSFLLSNPSLRFEADEGDKSTFFSHVAVYSEYRTLVVLKDQWPIMTSFEERFDVRQALDRAQSRRDSNESWSKKWMRPRDDDPIAWHEAFKGMIDHIVERSQQTSNPEDEAWEDAREQPEDLSLSLDAPSSA